MQLQQPWLRRKRTMFRHGNHHNLAKTFCFIRVNASKNANIVFSEHYLQTNDRK